MRAIQFPERVGSVITEFFILIRRSQNMDKTNFAEVEIGVSKAFQLIV